MIERAGEGLRAASASATRSSARLLFAVAIAAAALLALAPSALAAKKYVPVGQFPPQYPENQTWVPQEFNTLRPDSVAVSDKNHHIYVADSGRGAIFDFTSISNKTPTRWNGTTTPNGSFGGEQVSVAADNTTGDVYVADRAHRVIDKFDENGNLIASFGDTENGITHTPEPNGQLAGLKTPAGSFSPSTGSYSGWGIAVDQATHDLYVLDAGHQVIDIFGEEGAYLSQTTDTPEGLYTSGGEYASGIAVSSTGNVYVSSWGGPNRIFQFGPTNKYVSTWDGHLLPNGAASETPDGNFSPNSVGCCLVSAGVEDSTGHVFVADFHYVLNVFDANGNFIPPQATQTELGPEYLNYPDGVTVDQETGYIYVSQNSRVQIFKPAIVPDVSVKPTSGLTATEATINGHVDPVTGEGGSTITDCHFEYIANFDFGLGEGGSNQWTGAKKVPCSPNAPISSPTDVSASLTGLKPGSEYHFRLIAESAEGENKAIGADFATVGPYGFSTDIGSTGSGDGQLQGPKDVAVDQSSGDIYVADTGNHRVVKFSSSGAFLSAWGWGVANGEARSEVCASGCQAGISGTGPGQFEAPTYVEVDNSSGASAHDVYVADGGVVQKFDEDGNLIASWGTNGAIDFSKGGKIDGITVANNGDLFVITDKAPNLLTELGQDGISRTTLKTSGIEQELELGVPGGGGLDVDSSGSFYEAQIREGGAGVHFANPTSYNFSGHSYYTGHGSPLVNSGLVVDRPTNDLYVSQGNRIDRFPTNPECKYGRYGATGQVACAPQTFGIGDLTSSAGLAFESTGHRLYAADSGANDVAVFVKSPSPVPTTGPVTNATPTSGTLTGHVEPLPSGGEATECNFEYIDATNISDEYQKITLAAVSGTGTLTKGSHELTGVTTASGSFAIGEKIEGEGIPEHTFIVAVGPGTLELSAAAEGSGASVPIRTAPTGGSFRLTFEGQTTGDLPYNTSSGGVKEALERLITVHTGSIAGNGKEGGPYQLRFIDSLAQVNVPQLIPDSSALEPAGSTVTVTTLTQGYGWSSAGVVPCSPGGTFTTPTDVSAGISGLVPFSTYDYRLAIAGPSKLTNYGREHAYTPTQGVAPKVDAASSSGLSPTGATLSAQINPEFAPTTYSFQYGTTPSYESRTLLSPSIGEDGSDHTVHTEISRLQPGTTYHFRVLATNINGTTAGPDQTFSTPDFPAVAGSYVSSVTQTSAVLNAGVKPNFSPTAYVFQFGHTRAYGTEVGGVVGSDGTVHPLSAPVSGLLPETTYHFRLLATNAIGTTAGPDVKFLTEAPPRVEPVEEEVCKPGFVKRHGKCVKKKHHKPHHKRHGGHRGAHHGGSK